MWEVVVSTHNALAKTNLRVSLDGRRGGHVGFKWTHYVVRNSYPWPVHTTPFNGDPVVKSFIPGVSRRSRSVSFEQYLRLGVRVGSAQLRLRPRSFGGSTQIAYE